MSNLLPENSRLELRSEYRARYVLAGSLLSIGVAIFISLALVPSYQTFSASLPKDQNSPASKEAKTDLADVSKAQALVQQLSPIVSSTSSISRAIDKALAARPKGVHIDDIQFVDGESGSIAIGGMADDRGAINAYRTSLQSVTLFTGIKLPVGDLIGTQGGRFNVTLSGNF